MEEVATVIVIIFGFVLFVGGLLLFGSWVSSISCKSAWSQMESKYGITAGCQLKVKGQWIPADNYRVF